MQATFVDTHTFWQQLLPLSYTRPVAHLRVGILKIHEKWGHCLGLSSTYFRTENYLEALYKKPPGKTLCILGAALPNPALVSRIQLLAKNQALTHHDRLIAGYFDVDEPFEPGAREKINIKEMAIVNYPWDIFRLAGQEIRNDYERVTKGRTTQAINDPHTKIYGSRIFLEQGAKLRAAILNAENGPIYLGKNSEVQEGAIVKGPFALCEHAVVNMGAKMRGDSSVGPFSKVGGEIANSVIQGYSNKGHEGFLGNAVLGEWCNVGAGTNNSNMKNNYAHVKMWDFATGRFKDTGLQFCGLVMGDHAKCGINTMFNTGTTVGVSANIFGDGFPRNFIPSFAWGGASGLTTYPTKKAFETAAWMMNRRNRVLTAEDKSVLSAIFENTAPYRAWEKNH